MVDLRSSSELGEGIALGDHYLQCLLWHASVPECLGKEPSDRCCYRSRLKDTGVARCQCCHYTSARDGTREVPWRDDQDRALGLDIHVFEGIELLHRWSVETSVVDTFAHLHVALDNGLAGDGTHAADEVATHLAKSVGCIIHYLMAFFDRGLAPS